MAQRIDNPGDTSFLVKNQPTNQWLVNKSDINPSYSVLDEYYARQAAAKAAQRQTQQRAQQVPVYSGQGTYMPSNGPTGQVLKPQPVVAPATPQVQNLARQYGATTAQTPSWQIGPTQPTQQQVLRQTYGTNIDYTNWYRGTTGMAPANIQQARQTTGMGELQRVNGPYEYNPTGAYSNQTYGPPAYLQTRTVRPYHIAATTARMQEAEATGYGQLPLPHLPPPPTTNSGAGTSAAGYYDPYSGYGYGGGGGGDYSYDTSQKWWTNTAVWRI